MTVNPNTALKFRVIPRAEPGRAFLEIQCSHTSMGKCLFPLWRREAADLTWKWDGNVEAPTISPSIDCKGGCGRHFIMTAGRAL